MRLGIEDLLSGDLVEIAIEIRLYMLVLKMTFFSTNDKKLRNVASHILQSSYKQNRQTNDKDKYGGLGRKPTVLFVPPKSDLKLLS